MELPAMKVSSRPGRVGKSRSIPGLKARVIHSMVIRPRPTTRLVWGVRKVKGEYSLKRPLSGWWLHSTAATMIWVPAASR